jgi:hypothetical protein
MIPETHQSGRIEVWRSVGFPDRWELHATALDGTRAADTVLVERSGQWWIFTNLCLDGFGDHCSELHVFRTDGPQLGHVEPHPLNPVVVDSRTARAGGRVFFQDGRLLRVSQINSHGVYGYGLNIIEIERLDERSYRERVLRQITPGFENGIMGCHHFDAAEGQFVIDVRSRIGGFGGLRSAWRRRVPTVTAPRYESVVPARRRQLPGWGRP